MKRKTIFNGTIISIIIIFLSASIIPSISGYTNKICKDNISNETNIFEQNEIEDWSKEDRDIIKESVIPSTDSYMHLQYKFSFSEPKLQEISLQKHKYTKVTINGAINVGKKAGVPTIPVSFARLLIPAGRTISNINVFGQLVDIKTGNRNLKEKPLVPYQNQVPINKLLENNPENFDLAFDASLYSSNRQYPSISFEDIGVGYCRGYAILCIALYPVQYIPITGKLSYYPKMTITLDLEESEFNNPFYRGIQEDEEWVKTLVDNPEITDSYTHSAFVPITYDGGLCDPSDNYDYVIITTTDGGLDHWETTPSIPYNWTSLMDKHEVEDYLSCTLVTKQEITACPDYMNPNSVYNGAAARIREFCRDAYLDWGTEYIFIGGDDEWITSRKMSYEDEIWIDSDIYWNHLDGTFNDDEDIHWGEEGDSGFDLYSEMYIGRITCDEPQDVSNWMKKSFYYTDSNYIDYLDNAAFYGGNSGWLCEGDDFIDFGAIKGTNNWIGPNPGDHGEYPSWLGFLYGFETWNAQNPYNAYNLSVKWTAEPPNPGWNGGSDSVAINGLRDDINNDNCTLISGVAHANKEHSLDVNYSTWENEYHNTKPFFIHDFGCHCGDMDAADDGVLHSMLFHSDTELAFACVYNTMKGWGSWADTNSSSALQQKLFWDYLFDTTNNSHSTFNWQLGKAMAFSKDEMAPTINWRHSNAPGAWRAVIQGCLLFGDPAQRLKPLNGPEHNIGIEKIQVSSHEPADTDIWVNITLYNNGKHNETNVEVRFFRNDIEENTTVIPQLEKNKVVKIGWLYHTPSLGWETYRINVTLIPGENNTNDNEISKEVIYGPDIAVSTIQAPSYIGLGYPQIVKGYIENLGVTDETITIQFYTNSILNNSTMIFLTSREGTWVSFIWDGMNLGVGTYPVMIHAFPVLNETHYHNQNKSQNVIVRVPLIYYVDDVYGNDGPDNPPEDFNSIQEAIDNALPADTIYVYNGTYYETVELNESYFLIGEDQVTTIIDAQCNGNVIHIMADYVTISGFTLQNTSGHMDCIRMESSRNTIVDNTFRQLFHDYGHDAIHGACSNYNIISWNTFEHFNRGSGISLSRSSYNVISENIFSNNKRGIYLYYCNDNMIYHNSFLNNSLSHAWDYRGTNIWDHHDSMGNYWDDYNECYPDATNNGIIWDTPYVIPGGGCIDRFPLVHPYQLNPLCGDMNMDDFIDISDLLWLVDYIFVSGPAPVPDLCVADISGDGAVDISDLVWLVDYMFLSGPAPVEGCCGGI